jgi:hypothetical protein
MTLRELWEDYVRMNILEGIETPEEIALQKCAFICGVAAAIGTMVDGIDIDLADLQELIDEACGDVHLTADKVRRERRVSNN